MNSLNEVHALGITELALIGIFLIFTFAAWNHSYAARRKIISTWVANNRPVAADSWPMALPVTGDTIAKVMSRTQNVLSNRYDDHYFYFTIVGTDVNGMYWTYWVAFKAKFDSNGRRCVPESRFIPGIALALYYKNGLRDIVTFDVQPANYSGCAVHC